ncbi:hypothetical protein GGI15_003272 [Coemansia interrupta]|uniref:TM7S3/TM198-like domain-containing protein n=1 Tax=Coemansia interrupta TaxID=1126814 RepID=A0A9W8LJ36_9FUNG|nr:hypothetical protein GGI15_003272 [Coemansia interrupta]
MHPDNVIVGLQLIGFGVTYMCIDLKYRRLTAHISLYLAYFSLTLLLCKKIRPSDQITSRRRVLYTLVSMLQGVSATMVSTGIARARWWTRPQRVWASTGSFALGALAGCSLGTYILGMSAMGLFENHGARAVVVISGCMSMGVVNVYLPLRMFSVCSAVLGAYSFVLGVDCFSQTGYVDHLGLVVGVVEHYDAGRRAVVLQAAALVLALASALGRRACAVWKLRYELRSSGLSDARSY